VSDVSPLEAEVATLIVQTLTLKVDPAQIQPEEPLFGDGLGLD
jgi:acyl carrier protein